ncbi:hypothetical protein [Rhizobium sp. 2MFCol3.1]|jgi:hypothetical protein|uniref:hypothetical protein n=1 Tax=Rhizobium sp. 2MFCol3.1 TaxID=1246459 RepID=UPI0003672788|nr:hypothetical protein [Rhizobium sp. 2MFCol3.1]
MSRLFGRDFITQKYLRQYPNSKRAQSWAGVMVQIQTENGVWRHGGSGYTWPGHPDAWIVPFEFAVEKIDHCGPEKCGRFLRATPPADPLRSRIMKALFDPGATEGFKGNRDLVAWQADAVMRIINSPEAQI